jgi:hypothetical protein
MTQYCCGGGYNGLGCGKELDTLYDEYDYYYVEEYDNHVMMHVECADLAGLEI